MRKQKVEKSPSMPLYGKDIYSDERALLLNFAEQGLYIRLLWYQWQEGSIPDSVDALAVTIPRGEEVRQLWPGVSHLFDPHPSMPGRLLNDKLEKVRAELTKFRKQKQANGRKGGRPKANGNQNHNQNETKNESKDEPKRKPAFASSSALKTTPTPGDLSPGAMAAVIDALGGEEYPYEVTSATIGKWISSVGAKEAAAIAGKYRLKNPGYITSAVQGRAIELQKANEIPSQPAAPRVSL